MQCGRRLWATFTIQAVLVMSVFSGATPAQTLVMPKELVDFALANHCTQIDDFFEDPGTNPPYAYGWVPGTGGDSAVFWCKKMEKSDKPYSLMFKVTDSKQLRGCPAMIEWPYPRGLSIETRRSLQLHDFRFVTALQRSGPMTVVANARVILNSYDGVTDIFYCHQGQWLVRSLE